MKPVPRKMPKDMQAAIDAYDGKVTVCPPRTYTPWYEIVPKGFRNHKWTVEQRKKVSERRELVRAEYNKGLSGAQVAENLGIPPHIVANDIQAMAINGGRRRGGRS